MENERDRRKRYNEAAVKYAGEFHARRYPGLIAGAELPPALAAGGRIGMIGISDDIRAHIPRNIRYKPRTLVPMVNGEDVKLPGEDRVHGSVNKQPEQIVPDPEQNMDLEDLLND